MKAWHFLKEDYRTGEGNLLVTLGETMTVSPPVKLCHHGLHFSVSVLDALFYAPGPIIQRVEVPDDSILESDKGVAVSRKCLWLYDATNLLHEFACQCAESALMIANVDDERSWNAIHVKREWIAGRASDNELASARDAAWEALMVAAWDAAREAAWDAALASARDAAWEASMDAARAAAWEAARASARDAAMHDMASNLEYLLIQAGCA